jgi:Zn-dependent oligopeptidase
MVSGSRKEHTMTDWNLIVEHIQNAMQAVDQAHEASENLRNQATPETFDEFKEQMQELCENLSALKNVMEHTSTYTIDELVDVLSQMSSGKPAAFRRTRHLKA